MADVPGFMGRADYGDIYYPPPGPGFSQSDNAVVRFANATGRVIFELLTMGNVVLWMLVAPALTATGLTKERERGLLESLWLSPFKMRSQILGRLGATLCFLFLLQVATLPAYSIAFMLGGVSQGEIALAGSIIGMTALFGASLGMWLSACSYRGTGALGGVVVIIGVWSAVVWYLTTRFLIGATFNGPQLCLIFAHPFALIMLLLEPSTYFRFGISINGNEDLFKLGFTLQAALIVLMLWSAIHKAARPLPIMRWSEGNSHLNQRRQALNAALEERKGQSEDELASQKVAGALLYELPIEKFVRFQDPLLSKEVRGHFRLRQAGKLMGAGRFIIFFGLLLFWMDILFQSTDSVARADTGQKLLYGLLVFGLLAVGVMASTSLVRERESGTWEGLQLSLLKPTTLVLSKWLSPLITFAYWSTPLWILLPVCLRWNGDSGVTPAVAGAVVLLLIGALGATSAWGLWISSRAPHSAAGTSWTLATLLFILGGFPLLNSMFNITPYIVDGIYGPGTYATFVYGLIVSSNSLTGQVEYVNNPEAMAGVRHLVNFLNCYNPFLGISSLFQGDQVDLWTPLILGVIFSLVVTVILLRLTLERVTKTEPTERR